MFVHRDFDEGHLFNAGCCVVSRVYVDSRCGVVVQCAVENVDWWATHQTVHLTTVGQNASTTLSSCHTLTLSPRRLTLFITMYTCASQ